ncbi:hypothetical protein [Streptomyces sp. CC219B]|uniref:hypothetical protein n=1 Tax=Streptomyces sp. CC219B TaxID=3044574 RepID=UPI0024A8FBC8|nr:hypothetical protein [Streptomyces sp. CC219B]
MSIRRNWARRSLIQLPAARSPFFLKRKQNPDPHGTIRLQCPVAEPSPAVPCARFHQVRQIAATRPVTVGLANPRATTTHTAAKPTVPVPTAEQPRPPAPEQLPKICQQPTLTVRPGDLGKIDKFCQDRHCLQPSWQNAYRPARANIKGLNSRAKSHGVNIADPSRRLAHGRVAQTILLAPMILTINLDILRSWTQTDTPAANEEFTEENTRRDGQRTQLVGLRNSTARRHPHHPGDLTPPHHAPGSALPSHGLAPPPAPDHHRFPGGIPTSSPHDVPHDRKPHRTHPGKPKIPPDLPIGRDLVNYP